MPQDAQRVAIVTGAARGIGAATARRLAADGLAVAVLDLDAGACGATVDAIASAGGRAFAVGADVSQADQVEAAVGKVVAELGPPVVLVNNAGVLRDNLLFKMSEDDWDTVLSVHLRGAFLMSRAAQKHMVDRALRPDHQPVIQFRARQPRPGQLLRRQGRHAGIHQDARHRARPVRRHRQRGRARLHRHRHDRGDRGPDRDGFRGLPDGGRRPRSRSAGSARSRMSRTSSRSWPARVPASCPARLSTWQAVRCADRTTPGSGRRGTDAADLGQQRPRIPGRPRPGHHGPAGLPARPLRRRAGLGALPAWPRRAGPAARPAVRGG